MSSLELSSGQAIPLLGLGTWQMRGQQCAEVVQMALEMGYRHVDTAHMYANQVEVGAGLRASGVAPDEVFVTTKIWRDSLGATGIAPFDLGDANGDARVDGVDYHIWKEQFQGTPTGAVSSSVAGIAVTQDTNGTNGNAGAFSFTLVPGLTDLDSAGPGSSNRVRQIDVFEDAALDPTARELALEILTDLLDRPAEPDIDDSWQWPDDDWEQSNPSSVSKGIEIALALVELNGIDSNG